jgi:DNA polymerase-3 subunit alpha
LVAIKNVGGGAIEPIITERGKRGDFKSIEDLCRRADLSGMNKRVMESLIKAGALDCLGERGTLLHSVDRILSLAQREKHLRETGQSTMFDLWGDTMPSPMISLDLQAAEIPTKQKLTWEKELMGIYLSEHPFSSSVGKIGSEATLCGQVDAELAGKNIVVAGMVASIRHLFTRDRRAFISTVLEDLDGQVDVMVWPKVYAGTKDLWQDGNMLLVEGKVRLRNDNVQINCERVSLCQPEVARYEKAATSASIELPKMAEETVASTAPVESHKLVISISQTSDKDTDIIYLHKLLDTLRDFPGQDEVRLRVTNGTKIINLKVSNIRIGYCAELQQRLVELVGEGGFKVE